MPAPETLRGVPCFPSPSQHPDTLATPKSAHPLVFFVCLTFTAFTALARSHNHRIGEEATLKICLFACGALVQQKGGPRGSYFYASLECRIMR